MSQCFSNNIIVNVWENVFAWSVRCQEVLVIGLQSMKSWFGSQNRSVYINNQKVPFKIMPGQNPYMVAF